MNTKWRRIGAYSALALGAFLAICVLVVTLVDWNHFKGPLERYASHRLGRDVEVESLHARVWSLTPALTVGGLQIGNPPWETRKYLAQIGDLQVQLDLRSLLHGQLVLRRLALVHPRIYLHQEMSGRNNWTFATATPGDDRSPSPLKLPAIRDLIIDSGELTVADEQRRLDLKGTIDARENPAAGDSTRFRSEGHGTINHEPFRFELSGGPLLAISPDHPYPFTMNMQAGTHEIKVDGTVPRPFDLSRLELQVAARGRDMAELYYLTQLALPNSPPYQVEAHVERVGQRFEVRDIKGLLGTTDIGGTVDIDASHKRPMVVAKLVSRHLVMKDLGTVTGSHVGGQGSLDSKPTGASSQSTAAEANRLFPDARLQVNRVQGMDAEVTFSADTITAGAVPFTHASVVASLKDGVLSVHPARFEMPQGRLSGIVSIDTRVRPPAVHLDLRATDIELEQVKGKSPKAIAPLGGILQARANLEGRGDSVRSLMADANGTVTGVIPHGDIRSAFAELTGIDVAAGLGLLFKKPDDRAAIRCGLVQFDIDDGDARADRVMMDTQNVLITGRGQVELGTEKLDLEIEGHPKKIRLVQLKSPIRVTGHVLEPAFKLDAGRLAKQGAIAAALGTVLTPLASILAFVDPGLAKDQNCAQLNGAPDTKPVTGNSRPPADHAPVQLASE